MTGLIRGKQVRLDACIKAEIEALNRHGVMTVASCCGHGHYPKTIVCKDRAGRIYLLGMRICLPRRRRFYKTDAKGFYFIPEVIINLNGMIGVTGSDRRLTLIQNASRPNQFRQPTKEESPNAD